MEVSSARCFGGLQKVFKHDSAVLGCSMNFGVYLPPRAFANTTEKLPVLYYLSGLTCTEANFIQKSGFQRYAAEHNIIVVNPDTSPRNCNLPHEDDSWDFGTGAGFYLNATQEPWSKHYKMYDYVLNELPKVVENLCPADGKKTGVTGHSMGGHGALILALKNPGHFKSVSAFAPICNPAECPWGKKAFEGYLGSREKAGDLWNRYDATRLAEKYDGPVLEVLIDQGSADQFLTAGQLLPENFVAAAKTNGKISVEYRLQEDYDHSYFFISTFMADHFAHHAKKLKA